VVCQQSNLTGDARYSLLYDLAPPIPRPKTHSIPTSSRSGPSPVRPVSPLLARGGNRPALDPRLEMCITLQKEAVLAFPAVSRSGLNYVSCFMLRLDLLTNATCGKRVFQIAICCIRFPWHFGQALKPWAALSVAVLQRMADNSVMANSIIRSHRTF